MLQIKQFRKFYHHRLVLSVSDFSIGPGIYWVKGANGSGKSTLLRSIAGILHFEGDILLHNKLMLKKHTRAYRSEVNFAEAEPVFPPYLSGQEMIALFASAKNAAATQAEQYIDSMQMQTYIKDPLNTYSSGMLKKLSLVLAFIGKPSLVLLDEPLITMDGPSLRVLYSWIRESREQGVSFLLSSHQSPEEQALPMTASLLVEAQTLKLETP
ncbi:ABC-2 type transport system ATP-binding protein [Chitinophaga eiseniae]|uniref:ABC-2 type transport system ATP-binding protein n=1 Tax=Chitinophaga eiseniae TaxID=634771 RepID=A0A1T4T0Q9_9BACT|nr:ATP-binding cassette domain-containing protein [Chitinophaga eiseniae]SKA33929.1 ABC-2 type transport system ATP-binding protein [Chitinophaga eiseniae]